MMLPVRGAVSTLFLTSILCAQSNFASLSGRIEDASHAPVSSARVLIKAKDTGAARSVLSNREGLFDAADLPPGAYSVAADAPGFGGLSLEVTLEVNQHMALDLRMEVSTHHEAIAVTAAAETLKTQDASLGEVVERKSIQDLPLNGRMLLDLALTVPGAHEGHGAQTGTMNPLYWRPGQASAITIGGNRPNANYFLLDGVTNTDPAFNTQNFSPSPDAVREFQVQTGSYRAEMGGAGGGQINIITKSGTSELHGTAYEYLRNSALDARTWDEMPGTTHLVQHNFGGALGGPVYGSKTFFFAHYEGYRQTQAMTSIDTVPTALENGGDFSQSGVNIFDPSNSQPNPNYHAALPVSPSNPQVVRSAFPGNVIPSSRLSSAAVKMLQDYTPLPNMDNGMMGGMTMMGTPTVLGNSGGQDSNNLLDVRGSRLGTDQGTARIDRLLNGGDFIFGRYSITNEHGFYPQNLPGYGFYHQNMGQNGAIIWTKIISPTMVNTASIAISRLAMFHHTENNGTNDIVDALGITGVNFGGPGAWGAPSFNVQGYSAFGDSWLATPMHMWDTMTEGRDTLSWQRGAHSLKFGGSYRWFIWPMWALVQSRGYYTFTNGFTTQTATNDGTGDALASFLLGLPATRQVQNGVPTMDLRQWSADAFVQDTWRITPHTTIDAGLRYEFMAPLVDVSRRWSNLYQTATGLTAFIGGEADTPRGLWYPNKLRFAPRVGLAHHFENTGLVLRAAYGIFYTPVDLNTWCNQLHNVPLVFPITQQSDNFTPGINGFNFPQPVLGSTVVSFTAFDPHAPAQYVQQWSASIQKSLGRDTTVEVGYHGERGLDLQRAHLINNDQPGPGTLQPRRPYPTATFLPGTVIPAGIASTGLTFPVSTVNMLENTAQSWYDAGYVTVRRRYSKGLTLLANYTYSKNLSDAPDFRSPMFESSIPQNNSDLEAEKGPGCDVRHRFVASVVYDLPDIGQSPMARAFTRNWRLSTLYQVQSGFPFTISVYGDTANAGTVVGENPIRANATGQPVFGPGTQNTNQWFSPAAFATPAAYTFGNLGRNTVYGPGMQTMDLALTRAFTVAERLRLEMRGEAYNALNHSNWGTPNRFVNTPQFGSITEASTPGREFQLSARLSF
ncbi:MAG TPA: carboxypeptidase regulatory-like domain-containing protein [Bryobacteraceae bacterium]|nr:carboxypeptidase regulatory-like domain-containing protein [Bryobacteraceae bacterium]